MEEQTSVLYSRFSVCIANGNRLFRFFLKLLSNRWSKRFFLLGIINLDELQYSIQASR